MSNAIPARDSGSGDPKTRRRRFPGYLINEGDELLTCAMQVCDHHGDSDAARDAMRADVLALPPHLRADLRAHFQQAYQL